MKYLVIYNQKSSLIPPAMFQTTLEGVLDFIRAAHIGRIRAIDVSKTPGAVDGVEIFYDSMPVDSSVMFIALENAA
jgi:hypothetical protein